MYSLCRAESEAGEPVHLRQPPSPRLRRSSRDFHFAHRIGAFIPGFPICLPQMAPLSGISVLGARIRTLIRDLHFAHRISAFTHQHASPYARFLQRTLFCSQLPSVWAALDGKPTGAAAFRAFLRHRCTRVPCLRHEGFVALSPRVSLPARVAPRSFAACRRTAAGSDALPPARASSTAHASPAGLQFSPTAAGDS